MDMILRRWQRQLLICAAVLAFSLPGYAADDSPRDPAWHRRWSKPGGCIPRLRRWKAREAEARAAQDIAAGLTPEPGSVSFGSIGDRLNRNQGKQEYEVELATSALAAGTKGGTRSRGEQPHR
jgi:hypothetical protein